MTNPQYIVVWDEVADSDWRKIDIKTAKKIIDKVENYLSQNPRNLGMQLTGDLSGLYRYRLGDYRVIYRLQDLELIVSIVRVAHRRDVYDM